MKGERVHTIIGNPFAIETRTTSNAKSNKQKSKNLKKVAQLSQKRGREEVESESEGELQVDRPKKKMRGASE